MNNQQSVSYIMKTDETCNMFKSFSPWFLHSRFMVEKNYNPGNLWVLFKISTNYVLCIYVLKNIGYYTSPISI